MKRASHPTASSAYHLVGQVGLTMVACILAGTWAGIKLDAWIGSKGAATAAGVLGGVLLGAAATGLLLYRSIPPWKP